MKTDYQFEIVSRIRKIREERGITQTALAKVLGISLGHIGNIESYDKPHKYTLKQLVSISKFLNINIKDIFVPTGSTREMSLDTFVESLIRYQEK